MINLTKPNSSDNDSNTLPDVTCEICGKPATHLTYERVVALCDSCEITKD